MARRSPTERTTPRKNGRAMDVLLSSFQSAGPGKPKPVVIGSLGPSIGLLLNLDFGWLITK